VTTSGFRAGAGASLRVAVVAGGPSAEASVSRASAAGVERALRDAGHVPVVIELDRTVAARLLAGGYDVVFPAVHGRVGEDGCLQGLLEILELRYVGSGVLASALAMSKPHAKAQFRRAGLPLAAEVVLLREQSSEMADAVRQIRTKLKADVVVKPATGGSAIGVEPVPLSAGDSALADALRRALAVDACVLVEEMKSGKEVTCAVLEDAQGVARSLPPTLIVPKAAGWYDFRSKYAPSGSVHECPPPFSPALIEQIQHAAVVAHRVLECRDLSRVDFVVDEGPGEITVLEVNTLPGMTATSLFPEAAQAAGISFPELCDRLVRRALARSIAGAPDAPAMPV
jgi:D-alanine-D-alanine ligase